MLKEDNKDERGSGLSAEVAVSGGQTSPHHASDGDLKLTKQQEVIIDKIIKLIASKLDDVLSIVSDENRDDDELVTLILSEFSEAKRLFDELGLSGQAFAKAVSARMLHPHNLALIMATIRKSAKRRKSDVFRDSAKLSQVVDRLKQLTLNNNGR